LYTAFTMGIKKDLSIITSLQVIFWLAYGFVSAYSYSQTAPLDVSIFRTLMVLPLQIILFYTCYYYLIPRFFEKRKYTRFFLLLFVLIAVITAIRILIKNVILSQLDLTHFSKPMLNSRIQVAVIIVSELLIALISGLMRVAKDKYEYEQKYQEAQQQYVQSELNFLKSQVSPHFLLNTLNNIYAFAVTNSPQTPHAVLKLSQILQYLLYDCNNKKITVGAELEAIRSYIDLFGMKHQEKLSISTDFSIANTAKEIEPLMLMNLTENAFKHSGIGVLPGAFIHISATETTDGCLLFRIHNSRMTANSTVSQYGGIGLQNISQRLNLNYPGKHRFEVTDDATSFSVTLTIPFL
jgi:two-component system, LytTR family, sensor kinase